MTDDRINAILDEISKVIVGKQLILKRVLASLLPMAIFYFMMFQD